MQNTRNALFHAVRYGLAAGVVTGSPAPTLAWAQEADGSEAAAELERIEVTGSRIRRTDIETASPIFVVQREDIERSGLQSIGDLLQELSIAGAGINTQFNNGGNGQTQLNLRNLGPQRVLVLLNGRRFSTVLGTPGNLGIDLNNIPVAVVKRIEILKDGASSIYGSDAIAGVVNIITRDDFDGLQANAYYGQFANENDGDVQAYDVNVGASSDRGNIFFSASYVEQKPVFAGDREISALPQAGTGTALGSAGTPQGLFQLASDGSFVTTDPGADVANLGADAFRPFQFGDPQTGAGSDFFNFAPANYLLTPQQRTNVFTQVNYDITDWLRFSATVNYNNRESDQFQAPTPLSLEGLGSNLGAQIDINENTPFNPLGQDLAALSRRLVEVGPRISLQNVDSYRWNAGLEGSFSALDRYFDWDVNWLYSTIEDNTLSTGSVNLQRVQSALDPSCFDDPAVPCLNLFGGQGPDGQGTITQEMVDFISFTQQDARETQLTNYTANLSGEIIELPAGPLGFAVGYEYRDEEAFDQPDALVAAGITSGNARQRTAGGFSVDEFYVELAIPLLAGLPFAERLDLSLSTRYSDYSTFGDTLNSKIGLEWQPFEDLLLRGTYSEGFRAPTVGELFLGAGDSFPALSDPCSNFLNTGVSQDVINNCISQGVPSDGSYQQANPQIRITLGGNANLSPEIAESYTAGLVYSPSWLSGLDLTVDYYNIQIDDVVTTLGAQTILNQCVGANLPAADPFFCQFITRDGQGRVIDLFNGLVNAAQLEVNGVDVTLAYTFPETSFGFFRAVGDVAWQNENVITTATGTVIDSVGFDAGDTAFAEYKANLDLIWSYGDWEAVYGFQFIDNLTELCFGQIIGFAAYPNCVNPGDTRELEAIWYHDFQLSYFFSEFDTRISAGVRNFTNEQPPISTQAFANSFNSADYRTPGRFPYVRLTVDF